MVAQAASRRLGWRTAFVGGLLASVSALPVRAATDAAAAAAEPGVAAVQEVIVTATKREENLQRVPVAVTALTPAVLAQH